MDRRSFLRASVAGSVGLASFGTDFWRAAYSAPTRAGQGPYGGLAGRPDASGLLLPDGFTSRVLARGRQPVPGTDVVWHTLPDGGATFGTDGGGWIYVSNSEDDPGGVTAVEFSADGEIAEVRRLLTGTSRNCSGGPTPWGTWLSCEEYDASDGGGSAGRVWECDPTGQREARPLPALGRFAHEAVAVDPDNEILYLSEDQPDGRLYRFTPASYPSLDEGLLEAAYVASSGRVVWEEVPDPSARQAPTRRQVPATTAFDGGEGLWFDSGSVYFTAKGDGKVRRYDIAAQEMEVVYDPAKLPDAALRGVDNITVSDSGDIFVAEDGGDMQLVMISREGEVAPFLQVVDEPDSELCGPAFSPAGDRLYVSSMRGGPEGVGTTYEITGPFRGATVGAAARTTKDALRDVAEDGGFGAGEAAALGLTAALGFGLGGMVLRRRNRGD